METLRWTLIIRSLPGFLKHCPRCGGEYYENSGRFRVNANGKRLDIWLVCRCAYCKTVWNLAVLERIDRRSISQTDYYGYLENSEDLVLRHVFDSVIFVKNHTAIDLERLDCSISGIFPRAGEAARVEVKCKYPLPLSVGSIIARALGLSISRVRLLHETGMLAFDGDMKRQKVGTEFSFTLGEGWN